MLTRREGARRSELEFVADATALDLIDLDLSRRAASIFRSGGLGNTHIDPSLVHLAHFGRSREHLSYVHDVSVSLAPCNLHPAIQR